MSGESTYKRLPGRRTGAIRRASLWDAGDHMLSVSGTTFSERYHRFYYRDIKALVLQKGPRLGSIGALLLLGWLVLTFGILMRGQFALRAMHVLWLAPLAWLAFIIYTNFARSCRVYVYTAVSNEELPALFRRAAAAKAIPYILNRISEVQAALPVEEREPFFDASPPAETVQTTAQPTSPQALYASLLFFILILGNAAFAFWYRDTALIPSTLMSAKIAISILNALEIIAAVWALFKLFQNRLLKSVRALVIGGLGMLALRFYPLSLLLVGLTIGNNGITEAMNTVHARYWVGTTDCGLSLAIGIAGLISLLMAWQNDQRGPESNL